MLVFCSFGCVSRNNIVGLCLHSMLNFFRMFNISWTTLSMSDMHNGPSLSTSSPILVHLNLFRKNYRHPKKCKVVNLFVCFVAKFIYLFPAFLELTVQHTLGSNLMVFLFFSFNWLIYLKKKQLFSHFVFQSQFSFPPCLLLPTHSPHHTPYPLLGEFPHSFTSHWCNSWQQWASSLTVLNSCLSSLEKCLSKSCTHFFIFFLCQFRSSLYIVDINPLSYDWSVFMDSNLIFLCYLCF